MNILRLADKCAFRLIITLILTAFMFPVQAQQAGMNTLRGRIVDQLGGLIVGATVKLRDASGMEKTATTNDKGTFVFAGLASGKYSLEANATGFAPYQSELVEIVEGHEQQLSITLGVALEKQEVSVRDEQTVSTPAEPAAGALILRGADLDILPDDPEALAEALLALAGPAAGPNGGQFLIDGFQASNLPSKESIREIVVNQNQPFSAEYDRLGFGRIEIFTKPGSSKFHGQGMFSFNDDKFNTRNPYAPNRAPFQERRYNLNLSGPLVAKRASFFVDFNRRDTDDNAVINAFVLDSAFRPQPFSEVVLAPVSRMSISPRLDYQLNPNHTLVGRYSYTQQQATNSGIGAFALQTRAYDTRDNEHVVQLTETAVLSQSLINETQAQFTREDREQGRSGSGPSISVLGAFDGGGPQVGLSSFTENRWEVRNHTSWAVGSNMLKAGARVRGVSLEDYSEQNFNGTYIFASLDEYADVLQRIPGVRPGLFTLNGGNPKAEISQIDMSAFAQDTWQARRNLTLSFGLRYEKQTNIDSKLDFAPRVAIAWSPSGDMSRAPKTIVRGGFGIFYERFNHNLTLQALRFDGINQKRVNVLFANFFPRVPSIDALYAANQDFKLTRVVADDLQSPYTMQSIFSVERQLPFKISVTATYLHARMLHLLRSRNINSFIPGTPVRNSLKPLGIEKGDVYQYESTGMATQHQLVVNVNNRFNRKVTLFGTYVLGKAMSDTDGAETFPINAYDMSNEYSRSSFDVRHRVFAGGTIVGPWKIQFNPFVAAFSGRPFNIITGDDPNFDKQFTERPGIATDPTRASVFRTPYGLLDRRPLPEQKIIPRNFGEGPAFFVANIRIGKSFGFGGGQSDRRKERPYSLTVVFQAQNIFNHTNPGTIVGNLRSPLFGKSNLTAGGFGLGLGSTSAGNRRYEGQLRFTF